MRNCGCVLFTHPFFYGGTTAMKQKIIHKLTIATVVFLLLGVVTAAASDVTAERSISDTTVASGDTFTVTVNVAITDTVYGIVLDEDLPAGWTVTENNYGLANPGIGNTWLWSGVNTGTKTLIYDVTVPSSATEGDYAITGTILCSALVDGHFDTIEHHVSGNSHVEVNNGGVVTNDIAGNRGISDTTVVAGDSFTVTVDVDITGTLYGPILDEDLPSGWTVTPVSGPSTYNAGQTSWLWNGARSGILTVVYEVTVPSSSSEGTYPITGTVIGTDGGSNVGPITVSGDNSIIVSNTNSIAGNRVISDTTVASGDSFTVTVDVDITGTLYGPILDEDLPSGWTVTPVSGPSTYNAGQTSWLWNGARSGILTVVYEVTVPSSSSEGTYPITGTVIGTDGGSNVGPNTVSGDNTVIIDNSDLITGHRTISDTSINAGETFTVTVNVDIIGTLYGPILDEDIPSGWTVTPVSGPSTYNAGQTSWLWNGAQSGTLTVVYDVTVPLSAADGTYPITGTVIGTDGGSNVGPNTVTGDNTVIVSFNDIGGERIISNIIVDPGDIFNVTVNIDITGSVYGPILDEDIPSGWTVTPVSGPSTYNAGQTSWLWNGAQSGTLTVVYDVTVPSDAAAGNYDILGTVLATVSDDITIQHDVTGDDYVTVCRWRDEWFGDDIITTIELQDAIHHWLEDELVAGCHLLTTEELQEIIALWLSS